MHTTFLKTIILQYLYFLQAKDDVNQVKNVVKR